MLNLHAPIEPGKTAAGLSIGDAVANITPAVRPAKSELRDGLELLDFGPVRVWARDGVIQQIGVRGEYSGYVSGTAIGIGSTIQQVVDAIGPVVEDDEENLIVVHRPGWCFETTSWRRERLRETVEENLDATITEICIFREQAS